MMHSRNVSKVSVRTHLKFNITTQLPKCSKIKLYHELATKVIKKTFTHNPATQQINTNKQDDQESDPTQQKRALANKIHQL